MWLSPFPSSRTHWETCIKAVAQRPLYKEVARGMIHGRCPSTSPHQMAGIESFGASGESWHLVHDAAHDLWCDRLRSENIPQSAQHAALSIFLLQDIKPIYLPTCQTCKGDGSERGAQEELSANLTFPIPHQAACRSENCKNSRLCLNCGMSMSS